MTRWRIDRSRYFTIPRSSGRRSLALGRLLDKRKPALEGEDFERSHKILREEVEGLSQAYLARHIEAGKTSNAEEAAIDHFVDGLWIVLRERVEHWQVFGREGARALAARQQPGGFDYAEQIARADRAAELLGRLFGPGGTEFTRLRYREQDEHMRTLAQVIEQEQFAGALELLVGPVFYAAARDAQLRYAEMVERRSARERGSSVDLRERIDALHLAIQAYLIALLAAIQDDDPANVEMIREALRPVDTLREQLLRERRRGQAGGEEGEPEWLDEQDFDELLAEEQAIEDELAEAETEAEAEAEAS